MDKKAINEAVEFNRLFDERIKKTRIITHEDLLGFDEAYNNDSAASVNWLLSKLKLLYQIIKQGDYISINENITKDIYTSEGLNCWICDRYPLIFDEEDLQ